ncbi:DUF1389 domain-containing protein [Chlamydia vaughanii]|uniref:DUF1389 domain-containing protein n=1 Tax=Chlamydia vaughanii TaxID=3112552 RepID=UPI0032B1B8BF
MAPPPLVTTPLSFVTLNIRKSNFYQRLSEDLHTQALIACSAVSTLIGAVLTTLIIVTLLPSYAVVGAAVALIISGVMLFLAIKNYLRTPMIPWELLGVIKTVYPKVIYTLCTSKNLTIQELLQVLDNITGGEGVELSNSLQVKLKAFGVEKLLKGCQDATLPPLDTVLQTHCPAYFLKAFIAKGTPGESIEARLGYSGLEKNNEIMNEYSWMFSQVVTQEEYEKLVHHTIKGSWHQVRDLRNDIIERILEEFKDENKLGLNYRAVFPCRYFLKQKIHSACSSAINWEQLQMIKDTEISKIMFLKELESLSKLGKNLIRIMGALTHVIDEESADYDPHVALMSWGAWQKGVNLWYQNNSMDGAAALMEEMRRKAIKQKLLTPLRYDQVGR